MVAGMIASYTPTTQPQHASSGPGLFSVPVCALSRLVWDQLHQLEGQVQIIGQFRRVINLLVDNDVLLALVVPEVGLGPFHIVVRHLPPITLSQTSSLWWEDECLHIDSCLLNFGPLPLLWDPMPPWEHLELHPDRLKELQYYLHQAISVQPSPSPIQQHFLGKSLDAVPVLLRALADNDEFTLTTTTCQLAGFGPGLTPSGDDFLAGVMLALRLSRYVALESLCQLLYTVAASRTNRLSREFLLAACRGHADERWHHLLSALCGTDAAALARAAHDVFDFGAHSGLDMVTGFLAVLFDGRLFN